MQEKSRRKRSSTSLYQRHNTLLEIFSLSVQHCILHFKKFFPLAFVLALVGFIIQPYSIPTLSDAIDWLALGIFVMGTVIVAILHGSMVYYINAYLLGGGMELKSALKYGFYRSSYAFVTGCLYLLLVGIGLLLFLVPGIYLLVSLSLAPIVVMMLNDRNDISFWETIKEALIESHLIVKPNWRIMFAILSTLFGITFGLEWIISKLLIDQIVVASLLIVLLRASVLVFGYISMLIYLYSFETDADILREPAES